MSKSLSIITVTLNTAVDRVLQVSDFSVGSHVKAHQVMRYPAGKGINVSRTLVRLGWMNVATGFVGEQHANEYERYLANFSRGSIKNQLLTVKGSTRENITILDKAAHTDTHIRTEGYVINEHSFGRIMSKVGLLARPNSVVVLSGSLPGGMELVDFYTLANVAMSAGSRVVLDIDGQMLRSILGLDVSIIEDTESHDICPQKLCWMVKPNREELAQMLGLTHLESEDDIVDAVRMLSRKVAWGVVTLGEDGAIMVSPDGKIWRGRVDVPKDRIVNTVGCGDTMVAGMIDGQMRELSPEKILKHSLALATANAAQAGVAEYELSSVSELEAKTTVECIHQ